MMDWEKFYAKYPTTVDKADYLKQVGHTIGGKSISPQQFELMLARISSLLQLGKDDQLLDLCCGNGCITSELALHCKQVVGVDFSSPLIEVAKRAHSAENISYHLMNVLDLKRENFKAPHGFNKVLMFGALQHFRHDELSIILQKLIEITSENRVIVLGHVPDRDKKWNLHNTLAKKARYYFRRMTHRDRMGTWWHRQFIENSVRRQGLQCTFHVGNQSFPNSSFRMDVRIS